MQAATTERESAGVRALQAIRSQHHSLRAVLRSIDMMLDRGPGDQPERFFDVLRAMLFYIDEFPERGHHPIESNLLFPKIVRAAPHLLGVVRALEADHMNGEARVRNLQHLLLAWELIGESRRPEFDAAARGYVDFYLEHMRREEVELLPAAADLIEPAEWDAIDKAFRGEPDPLSAQARDPAFDRLFTRIVMTAPEPIGVGPGIGRG